MNFNCFRMNFVVFELFLTSFFSCLNLFVFQSFLSFCLYFHAFHSFVLFLVLFLASCFFLFFCVWCGLYVCAPAMFGPWPLAPGHWPHGRCEFQPKRMSASRLIKFVKMS